MSATVQMIDSKIARPEVEAEILTPAATAFIGALNARFEARRISLLNQRKLRQQQYDRGELPRFLADTQSIRDTEWTVAPIPPDLLDRRVEITGPADRKMVINALNSGASVFMADFEDANAPTWTNCVEGQFNLRDANRRAIDYRSPEGKRYELSANPAVLFVRPRGWHMVEKHYPIADGSMSASLFDFGLYFFHNFRTLLDRGTAPYFYLPKLESHKEARLWNDVFIFAQEYVGIPKGTIRATVLIETISASFEMDEILYELRDHSAGLNCGRWDYIFSFIKKFRNHPDYMLPERGVVTMEQPFLRSYVNLLIHTCHKRGIHARGGMAAQIPIRGNPAANDDAMERVRQDKLREVRAGHDGTWVGQRVMLSVTRFITQRLKLKVNEAKSAVARPQERKLLGFSFTDGPEIRRAIAPKALVRFKDKIREITRQAKGISIETTVKRLATYMVGWRGYFGFCETPEVLIGLVRWVRLRLRCALWRQWKTPRRRRAVLLQLGVRTRLASNTAGSGRGPWYLARSKALSVGASNAYFRSLGLPSLFENY